MRVFGQTPKPKVVNKPPQPEVVPAPKSPESKTKGAKPKVQPTMDADAGTPASVTIEPIIGIDDAVKAAESVSYEDKLKVIDSKIDRLREVVRSQDAQRERFGSPILSATIAEREAQSLDKDLLESQRRDNKDKLRDLLKERSDLVRANVPGALAAGMAPITPILPDTSPDMLAGPVYNRSPQRQEERLREVESNIFTAEQMYSKPSMEWSTIGPRRRQTVITPRSFDKDGKLRIGDPQRYAVSRLREGFLYDFGLRGKRGEIDLLPDIIDPMAAGVYTLLDRILTPTLDTITFGPVRGLFGEPSFSGQMYPSTVMNPARYIDPNTGEKTFFAQGRPPSLTEQQNRQGGIIRAPRTPRKTRTGKTLTPELMLQNARKALELRTNMIISAEGAIAELREKLRNREVATSDQPNAYASISAFEDTIEQLSAESDQLRRIIGVSIPRSEAAEEIAPMYAGSGIVPTED
tara:strand:+ start:1449 stop:2843 length:1395 start_codon:yes stop_codon:yes gene_type:complete